MRPRLLAIGVLALLGGVRGATAGPEVDETLWRRLANSAEPGHAAAVEAWRALTPEAALARIRAGIEAKDAVVARLASELADPMTLELGELRRALAICARDPAWVANPLHVLFADVSSDGMGFGTPEMVAIVRTAATTPGFTFEDDPSDEYHRAMAPALVPELVPLLETENDGVARKITGWLGGLYDNATRSDLRPLFAKAFAYWRARVEAKEAGKARPTLASFPAPSEGPGVPEAVKALVRASIGAAEAGQQTWADPGLVRWIHDLRPEPGDSAFLEEVAKAPGADAALSAWAVRGLAALDPEGTKTGWRAFADGNDARAVSAAAEAARAGAPARLRALEDSAGDAAGRAKVVAWEVDAADARARWVAAAATARPGTLVDLRPAARTRYELELHVRIRDEDVAALGQALVEGGEAKRGAAWFFGNVTPEALTPELAAVVARRLAALAEDRYADEDPDAEDLDATLAALEVRAPVVLHGLLAGWVERYAGDGKLDALRYLARLGDTGFVEPMLSTWGEWSADRYLLGRVRGPRVTAFLKAKASESDDDLASDACAALAVALGLPEDVRWGLAPDARKGESFATEPYVTVRQRLLADDAEGALLALARGRYVGHLGSLRSERALALLRRGRDERLLGGEPVYWRATAELAVAGDAAARAEWRSFVRDGRVRMLDQLGDPAHRVLVADPDSAEDWIPLLDANCCLGFHAWSQLQQAYPTCPVEKIGPVMTPNRVAFERWYARHRGTFVWSKILDGYVPGPRSR